MYKVLTLWQPYASLVSLQLKEYETRSWSTNYRGVLLIHAAKRPLKNPERMLLEKVSKDFPQIAAQLPDEFPMGALLCKCQLTNCIPNSVMPPITPQEKLFGLYGTGRYAWKLSNVEDFYIPNIKGSQGLWTFNNALGGSHAS
ncbi:MAG TPA: hypothetical protein VFM18_15530 [Methanosarcina sp.]|nr:hypothetical protein [Methanosarcina sp.]